MYKEYNPLPKCCTISKSNIHGLGLFATEDISEGTDLGPCHYIIQGDMIRTPLGGFVNSSENPNLKMKRKPGTRYMHAIVTRNVKAGDELTGQYYVSS